MKKLINLNGLTQLFGTELSAFVSIKCSLQYIYISYYMQVKDPKYLLYQIGSKINWIIMRPDFHLGICSYQE